MALFGYLHRTKSRAVFMNLTLMVLSLFLTLMIMEFYFKNFFAEPDILDTLARHNWKEWYSEDSSEKPVINSLGYRDVEWAAEMVTGKVKVMVAGDSFVAGAGIARSEDRFSNRLAQKLGNDYVIFNVGKNGLNTGQVIKAITEYPYRPDILIFSYYLNDIESISPLCRGGPNPLGSVPSLLLPLVENSYAANFFYWRLARLIQGTQPDLRWNCLFNAYNDPDIWWLHQQELLSVYQGTQSEQIPLLVVVFPSMLYLEDSTVATGRVVNLYREKDIPVVDVTDLAKDLPARKRVVSPMDTHASELVNKLVAEALYDLFVELELVK